MQKETNQIFFNFKQVEKQPHQDVEDVMYDIQMNNEGGWVYGGRKRKNTT